MSTVRELNRMEVKAAVRRAIEASADEIIRLARDIYEHPEPGFTEERTAKVVSAAVAKAGLVSRASNPMTTDLALKC